MRSRSFVQTLALLSVTGLVLYVCFLIIEPFVGVLAWALALAVIGSPLYAWARKRISNDTFAAIIAVVLISIAVVGPLTYVARRIVAEVAWLFPHVISSLDNGAWEETLRSYPRLYSTYLWLDRNLHLSTSLRETSDAVLRVVPAIFRNSFWSVVQLGLILFTVFFLFRDRGRIFPMFKALLPMTDDESKDLITRALETVHVTMYGTLLVAVVQGTLGGLMFWLLGLPAPAFWGFVMAVLAIVPYLGAFAVWVPATAFLAANGFFVKAVVLALWGGVVVALIDNLLYPVFVGSKLRIHTLPMFFFILGGMALFGASGIVLGPLTLATADALLHVWRSRIRERASVGDGGDFSSPLSA